MTIDKGMFNFQGVMDQFYGYQPGKDDSEGRAIKNSFMANMVQSGFDSQLAKDMSQHQSGISQSNMTHAADLELRNTSSLMQQEFNYGMQSMGAQYDYQNKFADNQHDRDLGTLAATGEESRKSIGAEGAQDRLTAVTKGEQDRLGYQEQGKESRKNIAATGEQDRLNTRETGKEDRLTKETEGEQSRLTDTNRITTQGAEDRKGWETQGDQARKTMTHEDQLSAGKANRQAARSRTMARSF